jgi:superfamily II DNA/RNA helicase
MNNNFEQLGAASCFIKQLEERNINEPTEIQCKVIPRLMAGENVFFSSETGTGKTFAYLLPMLSRLISFSSVSSAPSGGNFGVKLLIVAPTLELCTQIKSELDFLLINTQLQSFLAIGSVSMDRQIENLKKIKPGIIVGNPNRLLVLAKKGLIKFNNLCYLVMDEADRLISDEMIDDTKELCKIIRRSSCKGGNNAVIAACSATLNEKCREKLLFALYDRITVSPEIVFLESEAHEILRDKIEHWAIYSEKRRKDQTLRSLLSALKADMPKKNKSRIKILVFTSRGDEAAIILSRLLYHNVKAAGLFGKVGKKPLSGAERKAALDSFRNGSIEALISTDLAARGLDIPGINCVVALDVPQDSDVYIHRCGRTGRAGKCGVMITIGDETQMHLLAAMEKKLKIKIYPKELHYGHVVAPLPLEED